MAATAMVAPLTPGASSSPSKATVEFRIEGTDKDGYRIDAVAAFHPGAASSVEGGATIAASDIGVGITSIVRDNHPSSSTRADYIQPGFDYDPGAVTAPNGLTPYTGAASGRATLADLTVSRKLLSGNRIGPGKSGKRSLDVTLTFGYVPQYFTPGAFSGVVTLTICNAL